MYIVVDTEVCEGFTIVCSDVDCVPNVGFVRPVPDVELSVGVVETDDIDAVVISVMVVEDSGADDAGVDIDETSPVEPIDGVIVEEGEYVVVD